MEYRFEMRSKKQESKSEIRSTKLETNPKSKTLMTETLTPPGRSHLGSSSVSNLGVCFGFRISSFEFRVGAAVVLLALCLCGVGRAGLAQRLAKAVGAQQDADSYSIQVVEPSSGTVLYSHNAHKPLMPASNMKVVTTAAALRYLGPESEYQTRIGRQNGALVVIGSGDPLLGDQSTDKRYDRPDGWIFEKIVQALKEQGVTEVNDIVVDTTVFDDQRVHPSWPAKDHNRAFACEVCGLNFNGNCIEVSASNLGSSVTLSVEPKTSYVQIVNEAEPVTEGDSAIGSYRTSQPNRIIVYGKCLEREGPFRVAIEQPAAFFGFCLAENLVRAGINAKGKLIEKAVHLDAGFQPLVEFTTPFADCLRRANTDSFNLVAEALIKTIDAHRKPDHKDGGWGGGRDLIAKYLNDLGIPSEEFVIDDGSGLSRNNRLTTHALSTILLDLYRGKNWELFQGSLAVGGEDGTIDKYFGEARYRGKVHAKTGYISGVRALSGVCLTDSGPYLFSVLSNGPKGLSRDAINNIPKAIIDEYAGNN
jgi:D-alanyl-D-alanine carboxypeptidase/D-alanyl-D-alanine-endopeptidase (penicillin-binding protein 4)